jgi:hypothetical protein
MNSSKITPQTCINYPICKCPITECQYHTNRVGEIKQNIDDHYNALESGRNPKKKVKRKHARNYTPSKKRHRK